MTAELYDATPQHRDNFIKLAEAGYFDSLLFHRVIEGFMIQGGDPNSKNAAPGIPLGSGGPGHTVPAEFVDSLIHVKGAIAAARTGDNVNPEKRSSGSQFYIVHGSPVDDNLLKNLEMRKGVTYTDEQRADYLAHGGTPFLDRDYTVFGKLLTGFDVLDKIAAVQKDGRDRPLSDVRMYIKVIR
jgi:peptidyl-prolyl cis-trans isomerase B (cyclophilin B)